jgi:ADP-ribose pyrophosphatase
MNPELLEEKSIYRGKIFDVSLATIREAGVVYEREIVSHHGSAVIVPVFEDKTVALVKQYRHAAREFLWEIPAGSLAKDELPEVGARRELEEEVGVSAGRLEKLTEFYVSPGYLTEKMHLFLATDLKEIGRKPEEDEILEIRRFGFAELNEMIDSGRITDAKTMVGILLSAGRLGIGA